MDIKIFSISIIPVINDLCIVLLKSKTLYPHLHYPTWETIQQSTTASKRLYMKQSVIYSLRKIPQIISQGLKFFKPWRNFASWGTVSICIALFGIEEQFLGNLKTLKTPKMKTPKLKTPK
jgi:hypothetical protein